MKLLLVRDPLSSICCWLKGYLPVQVALLSDRARTRRRIRAVCGQAVQLPLCLGVGYLCLVLVVRFACTALSEIATCSLTSLGGKPSQSPTSQLTNQDVGKM